jgi:2-iminobutanoate/2-iminopropanoate deaminase
MKGTVDIVALDSSGTPKVIGPYSKATRIDMGSLYMVLISGNIGLDPKTGDLVSDDPADQTRQLLDNIKNLLE